MEICRINKETISIHVQDGPIFREMLARCLTEIRIQTIRVLIYSLMATQCLRHQQITEQ